MKAGLENGSWLGKIQQQLAEKNECWLQMKSG